MHSTDHLRLFIALPATDQVKSSIARVQDQLRRLLPDKAARWTRPEQFHLTLRFLGNVAKARVASLIEAAQGTCGPFDRLQLTARGLGFFPDARFPRVLWVGIKDPAEQLACVWKAVQATTLPFTNEAAEEAFAGHITLARLKRLRRSEAAVLAQTVEQFRNDTFGQWTASELHLMRSELSSQGACHSVLAVLPLLGGNRLLPHQ